MKVLRVISGVTSGNHFFVAIKVKQPACIGENEIGSGPIAFD